MATTLNKNFAQRHYFHTSSAILMSCLSFIKNRYKTMTIIVSHAGPGIGSYYKCMASASIDV